MRLASGIVILAPATLIGAAFAAAQAVDQLSTGSKNGGTSQIQIQGSTGGASDEGLQITPKTQGSTDLQINTGNIGQGELQINKGNGGNVAVEQPEGRDLCDPSVSKKQRRAAGVDCSARIKAPTPGHTGLAQDSLLTPQQKDVGDEFESLDLGDDVPSTVILQQ